MLTVILCFIGFIAWCVFFFIAGMKAADSMWISNSLIKDGIKTKKGIFKVVNYFDNITEDDLGRIWDIAPGVKREEVIVLFRDSLSDFGKNVLSANESIIRWGWDCFRPECLSFKSVAEAKLIIFMDLNRIDVIRNNYTNSKGTLFNELNLPPKKDGEYS